MDQYKTLALISTSTTTTTTRPPETFGLYPNTEIPYVHQISFFAPTPTFGIFLGTPNNLPFDPFAFLKNPANVRLSINNKIGVIANQGTWQEIQENEPIDMNIIRIFVNGKYYKYVV